MKHVSLFIDHVGSLTVPENWELHEARGLQRLYYIKGGTGNIIDDEDNKTPFKQNHLYIFPYNIKQEFDTNPNDRIKLLYLDFISSPPIIADSYIEYNIDECSPIIKKLIDALDYMVCGNFINIEAVNPTHRLENVFDAPHGSVKEIFQSIYSLILSIITLLSAEKEIPYANDEVVTDALKYITRYYNTDIKISELARQSGYSTEHFIRRFSSIMGMTPYAYLRNYRLKRANELICNGMTNANAAEEVGYKNVSSFSKELSKYRQLHNMI